ncbi:MAG: hypothetical protein AB7O56_12290 [Bauldia sp.]
MRKSFVRAAVATGLLASSALVAPFVGSVLAADIEIVPPPPIIPAPMVVEEVPRFYFLAGALFVTRKSPEPAPILIEAPTPQAAEALPGGLPPGDILDASDFDFGWTFGFYARAGVITPSNLGVEVGGFWLKPMTATVTGDFDLDPIGVFLQTDDETFYERIEAFEAANTTRLYGLDANVVLQPNAGPLQLYAGVAYLRLRDALDLTLTQATNPTTDFVFDWETSNRLIGPQIGARVFLGDADPFSLTLDARVGYLRNAYTNAFSHMGTGGLIEGDDSGKVWSFMAAGGVTANFALNENLHLNVGYQAIFLNNVALAPHQVIGTPGPLGTGPETLDLTTYTSHVLFHGVSAGITLLF